MPTVHRGTIDDEAAVNPMREMAGEPLWSHYVTLGNFTADNNLDCRENMIVTSNYRATWSLYTLLRRTKKNRNQFCILKVSSDCGNAFFVTNDSPFVQNAFLVHMGEGTIVLTLMASGLNAIECSAAADRLIPNETNICARIKGIRAL